jgi:hypothetical protein
MPKETKDLQPEITLDRMQIERIGQGQYRCHSENQSVTAYVVDIFHYAGLGSCTCPDFTMRLIPRWRKVRRPYDHFRCKHLRRIRCHVLDQIIASETAKRIERQKNEYRTRHHR